MENIDHKITEINEKIADEIKRVGDYLVNHAEEIAESNCFYAEDGVSLRIDIHSDQKSLIDVGV